MNKNKGLTLVELIVSVALISIVIVFLFQLLIELRYQNLNDTKKVEYKVAATLIAKKIQSTLMEEQVDLIETCDETSTCLKIIFITESYLEIKITDDNKVLSVIKKDSSGNTIMEDIRQIPEKDETGYLGSFEELAYTTSYFAPNDSGYDYRYDSMLEIYIKMKDSLNNEYPIEVYYPYIGGTNFSTIKKMLTVYLDGGTWSDTSPKKILSGNTVTINNPIKSGYTFAGWTVTGAGSSITTADPGLFTMGSENATLTANWGPSETVFTYTGSSQTFNVYNNGYYELEVWGAQGGTYNATYYGGYGGYSKGVVYLTSGNNLFLYVGGAGSCLSANGSTSGGYNGGGNACVTRGTGFNSCAGGGATHISTISGELSTLSSSTASILIIAGGGGGSTYRTSEGYSYFYGGAGGGISGNNSSGTSSWSIAISYGGSQTAGGNGGGLNGDGGAVTGAFGKGGISASCTSQISGGGGGYYGGGSGNDTGGGGGSGYIANSLLLTYGGVTKAMYCYNCATSSTSSTLTYSTTNVSGTATTNYAKSGNGYAKITYLGT